MCPPTTMVLTNFPKKKIPFSFCNNNKSIIALLVVAVNKTLVFLENILSSFS
jgi:hypothetical protein